MPRPMVGLQIEKCHIPGMVGGRDNHKQVFAFLRSLGERNACEAKGKHEEPVTVRSCPWVEPARLPLAALHEDGLQGG